MAKAKAKSRKKLHLSDTARRMEGYLAKTARAISRNWDVDVRFTGTACATTSKTILLPYNAEYLGEDRKRLIHGNLDHETCHIAEEVEAEKKKRFTPLQVMKSESNRTVRMLFNAFEDVRIEKKYSKLYPGMAQNLRAINEHSIGIFHARHGEKRTKNFWHELSCVIIAHAQGMDYDWCPAPVLAWTGLIAAEMNQANDTVWAEDCMELARSVYAKVRAAAESLKKIKSEMDESESEPDEDQEGLVIHEDGGDCDDSDKGEDNNVHMDLRDEPPKGKRSDKDENEDDTLTESADGEAGDPADSDGVESDDREGELKSKSDSATDEWGNEATGEAGEGDAGEGSIEGGDETEGICEGDVNLDEYDPTAHEAETEDLIGDKVREDIEKSATDDMHKGRYVPHPDCVKKDKWYKPYTGGKSKDLIRDYQDALEGVRGQIGALRSRLLSAVRVMSQTREVGDQEQGRLDSASLHTVITGNTRVYSHTVVGQTLDTAVSILIDLSGSMDRRFEGSKSWYAHRTVIALVESFEQLRIPCEVIGFHNNHSRMPDIHDRKGYQCREPFDYLVFKEFDEPLRNCRERFHAVNGYQDNADGEAVRAVGKRLAYRPEKRKILFVISDGEPAAAYCDCDMLDKDLKDAVIELTRVGIEIFGIGVLTTAVCAFYNSKTGAESIVIRDLDKLATTVYPVMRAKLLRKRGRAA